MERIMGRVDTPVRRLFNYAPENLAKQLPIVYVLKWRDIDETMQKYKFQHLKEGFNTLPDGEELHYISSSTLRLWAHRDRFEY